jgi:hypothetical protein
MFGEKISHFVPLGPEKKISFTQMDDHMNGILSKILDEEGEKKDSRKKNIARVPFLYVQPVLLIEIFTVSAPLFLQTHFTSLSLAAPSRHRSSCSLLCRPSQAGSPSLPPLPYLPSPWAKQKHSIAKRMSQSSS